MIGIIVATHGGLAESLVAGVENIVGKKPCLAAVALHTSQGLDGMKRLIAEEIQKLGCPNGTLILTDMLGGTPCNASLMVAPAAGSPVEVISGVNLPMLLSAVSYRERLPLEKLTEKICEDAKKSVLRASALLKDAHRTAAD